MMPVGSGADQATEGAFSQPVMWLFLGVLVTFVVTRLITRFIRSRPAAESAGPIRDITIGGVHIHHQVWGIVMMLCTGVVLIAGTPENAALSVTAALFGVGVGLTFDEFALWVHLDDVYWAAEGRRSVDAIFCVLVCCGALIGGTDLFVGRIGSASWWESVSLLLINLVLSIVCVLKGKTLTAIVGVLVFVVGLVGAIRLAKPESWWARRRYLTRPNRQARSMVRFGDAYHRRWNRVRDFVAGAPHLDRP